MEVMEKKKKPGILPRILAFLLTLALVLGAVAIVAYREHFNFDAIKRFFSYRSLERNESGQTESFTYNSSSESAFAALGDGLIICTPSGVRLYSSSGALYLDKAVSMAHPVIRTAKKIALVYDAGGTDLLLFSDKELLFSLTLEKNRAILSASVNDSGWLAVTAQESGYRGSVTIYNNDYEKILQIKLSSRFVTDAVLSPDHKWVAVLTVGLQDGNFESSVSLYRVDRTAADTKPEVTYSIGNNVGLDLCWKDDGIWILGETGLSINKSDGGALGNYSYTGRYLKDFTQEGDGFSVLLLGKYRAGSSADLTVVDATGTATATLPLSDQVLDLSAAGKYISVLSADRLDIYTQDLTHYSSLDTTQGAQRVLQRADGTALLIGATTARLYVPK